MTIIEYMEQIKITAYLVQGWTITFNKDVYNVDLIMFALYAILGTALMVLVFFKKLEFNFFAIICFSLLILPWIYVYHSETDSVAQGYI